MTRLLVMADTHMPRRGRMLPDRLLRAAETADLIVHLGDFTEIAAVEEVEALGPLVAVHGNNDSPSVRGRFPACQILEIEERTICLIHGDVGGRTADAAAMAVSNAEIVLYGHSHRASLTHLADRLLFNPGSPTERRFAPSRSFGILEIGSEVEASIIHVP